MIEHAAEEEKCQCVTKHVPLPIVHYKVQVSGSVAFLCPTTYINLQKLLTAYRLYEAVPPGSVRKHYSKYVQELAMELYEEQV